MAPDPIPEPLTANESARLAGERALRDPSVALAAAAWIAEQCAQAEADREAREVDA